MVNRSATTARIPTAFPLRLDDPCALLIKFPKSRLAGQRVAARASLVDVAPTLLEAMQVPHFLRRCKGSRSFQ